MSRHGRVTHFKTILVIQMYVYLIHAKYVKKYPRIVSRLTKNAGIDTNCHRFFIININHLE